MRRIRGDAHHADAVRARRSQVDVVESGATQRQQARAVGREHFEDLGVGTIVDEHAHDLASGRETGRVGIECRVEIVEPTDAPVVGRIQELAVIGFRGEDRYVRHAGIPGGRRPAGFGPRGCGGRHRRVRFRAGLRDRVVAEERGCGAALAADVYGASGMVGRTACEPRVDTGSIREVRNSRLLSIAATPMPFDSGPCPREGSA